MSSRREEPNPTRGARERWRPESEVGPASGGHLAPDVNATGPLFENVQSPARERTEPISRVERERRQVPPQARRRQRYTTRRVKRTIRHIDPLSVFKLSLFFYALAVVAWLIVVAFLYSFVESVGVFDFIEQFREGFAIEGAFEITLFYVEKWALLIGLVLWLLGSLLNLLLAFLYNVGADMIGGVELTFVERDT